MQFKHFAALYFKRSVVRKCVYSRYVIWIKNKTNISFDFFCFALWNRHAIATFFFKKKGTFWKVNLFGSIINIFSTNKTNKWIKCVRTCQYEINYSWKLKLCLILLVIIVKFEFCFLCAPLLFVIIAVSILFRFISSPNDDIETILYNLKKKNWKTKTSEKKPTISRIHHIDVCGTIWKAENIWNWLISTEREQQQQQQQKNL